MDYLKDYLKYKKDTNNKGTQKDYLTTICQFHGIKEMIKAQKQLQNILFEGE